MNIKSFGCSFIFGSELPDNGAGGLYAVGSRFSWPAVLARHANYKYQCYARPGSGNLQIMEQVLNQSSNIEPAFFTISWTWIDRFDYIDENNPGKWHRKGNLWSTLMPVDNTKLANTYYRELHSEYRDKLTNLIYIKNTIDTLKSKNISFIMTYMDYLLFDTEHHVSPAILELQEYILPYMTTFDGMNFLDWSKTHNYPIGVAAHPLEEAHKAAGEYMTKIFDKQNTNDC